jgi:G3E family GTPase
MKSKLPVVIITGFLGSGKTTLLNKLLTDPALKATAIIINEFGEIGIDHLLVETSTEQMVELNNGCICCTIRGDLADKLGSLAMWLDTGRVPPVERVIVETTGLADPAPIMHTLMTSPDLLRRYELSRVVTLVDAVTGLSSLDRFPEAAKQVALADRLIVTKLDLVDERQRREVLTTLHQRLRQMNPEARVFDSIHGETARDVVVRSGGEESEGISAKALAECRQSTEHDEAAENGAVSERLHRHDRGKHGVGTFSMQWEPPLRCDRLEQFLRQLALDFGPRILRVKGIVLTEEKPSEPAVIHGVQHVFYPVSWLKAWPDGNVRSRLVFIVQDVEQAEIRQRFSNYFGSILAPR